MLKCSLIVSLLILSSYGSIEKYRAFHIENKEVVWVEIYHEEKSESELSLQLQSQLKRKSWIRNMHMEGNDVVADIEDLVFDYKKYGGKFTNTSTILRTGRWDGKIRVSFKKDKYRIIIESMQYTAVSPASGSGKASMEKHEISGTLTSWVLNDYRTSFRKGKLENLDIMHFFLHESFQYEPNQLMDSDW